MPPERESSPGAVSVEPEAHVERYGNGRLKMTGFHLAGEMHGEWAWYRTDGTVMRTGSFDRGRQVGPWRTFDRTGQLVKETVFRVSPATD